MKRILSILLLLPLAAIAQTPSENYVKTTAYKVPTQNGITATDGSGAVTSGKKAINVTYFDGLGRPVQQIAHQQSGTGKDLITVIPYDEFGRQAIRYLPYHKGSSDMSFDPNAVANVQQFYASPTFANTGNLNFESTTNAYSRTFFDASPLDRTMKQAAPGNDWEGHENDDADRAVKFVYDTNTEADKVLNFYINASQLACYGNFAANKLYKTITRDENWTAGVNHTIEEFRDNAGKILLKRAYESGGKVDTYYVYDTNGNLTFVIPPLASKDIATVNVTQTPYKYTQSIPLSELLINYTSGGGGGSIIIENNIFKVSFSAGFNSTKINTANFFTINAALPIPDMVVGTLIAGFERYTVYVQNNQLKFTDNYPASGNYSSLNHTISVSFDMSAFPTIPVSTTTVSQNVVTGLCYQYKYDGANRLIEKKIPGKGWEYIVYDQLDRIVATGPSNSPFSNLAGEGWLISKYDRFNRPVITGWMPASTIDSAARSSLQNENDLQSAQYISETKIASAATVAVNGIAFKYDNYSWPASTTRYHVLTVNYYDDYNYPNAPTVFSAILDTEQVYYNNSTQKPKGLSTGSWVRVLSTSTSTLGEPSYTLYDKKGRPVRTHKINHLGGYTYTDTKLDFTGKAMSTITYHKRMNSDLELKVRDDLTYTDQERLLSNTHQITYGPLLLSSHSLSRNTYDELGQLISKRVGGPSTSSVGLQKVDYSYNIRGWLKGINNIANLEEDDPKDLFSFKLNYNTVENSAGGAVTPLYNGNISESFWRTKKDNIVRKYGYSYDDLSRLREAIYQKPDLSNPVNDKITDAYNEEVKYDLNGNILQLKRNGYQDNNTGNNYQIDDLTYKYDYNRLMEVGDGSNSRDGFRDGESPDLGADYKYDLNGNMTEDWNKGIKGIRYNHLNLPRRIDFATTDSNPKTIEYLYNALGVKLRKVVTDKSDGQNILDTTDYLDGFQYQEGKLEFFPTSEGYVSVVKENFNYVYNYTDHLGNIRVSYSKPSGTAPLAILEENHYYPFGMKHMNYNTQKTQYAKDDEGATYAVLKPVVESNYQYKYNGKEYQNELSLNWYDYGARNYDAAIGRWMNIDPLAEKTKTVSPFVYAFNNPIFFLDPDGMSSVGADELTNEQWLESSRPSADSNLASGYISANKNQEQDEKQKAIAARSRYLKMIAKSRKDGHNMAADNLQWWLDGSGAKKIIDFEWLRDRREVLAAENTNIERFQEQLEKLAEGLKDGQSIEFSDYWDDQFTGGIFGELYYASGTSILTSKANFKISRNGDNINVSGTIIHQWNDNYDWHAGANAYIPGFGSIDDSDALLVEKYFGAKSFLMQSAWKHTFNSNSKIGFFGGININLKK